MKIEIKAERRSGQGTGASRRLRRESKVPGIVYGAGKDAQPIQLDHKDLWFKLKMEAFHASILEMELNSEKAQVVLRDYQMHPFRPIILHADFLRVAADKKIHMKVPLHFVNAEISPGVKVAGGLVQHVMNELEILSLPKDLPEFIAVDLANLQAGHSLHLSALKLPPGVEPRSEEHTSELQSPDHLVCRLLLEKKKKQNTAKFQLREYSRQLTPTSLFHHVSTGSVSSVFLNYLYSLSLI